MGTVVTSTTTAAGSSISISTGYTATNLPLVTRADIEAIVASWTGIPVESMSEQETSKLAHLVRVTVSYSCDWACE